ncbi:GNAT family N-acetyltransferase [Gorillibacterium sp. sgz5001074]|uniref:GNAT family N-acetyltransferase n=1 Tax=Gorillibacterium sp. sgz5001074 TaxID=3446695 RepID=UPI003F6757B8
MTDGSLRELRITPFSITDPACAALVYELQQMAYPVEAQLLGLPSLPPMEDTPMKLEACGETFIGCFEGERLVGMVSYKLTDGGETLDIHRMAVHPEYFRRGIARGLLRAVLDVPGPKRAIVSTGTKNAPAYQLYVRFGFQPCGVVEIAPSVTLTDFMKQLDPRSS